MTESPHSYLMHVRTNSCTTCGSTEQWSETFLVSFDPTAGTRHLQPINGQALDASLPFGISRLPTRTIPLCHCCTLLHQPTAPDYTPEQRWRETLQRKPPPPRPTTMICATWSKIGAGSIQSPSPRPQPKHIIAELDQL